MILLMGGTSESAAIAGALARAGYPVLVSMATEVPLLIEDLPGIHLRRGRLSQQELETLLCHESISALIDATHPYALEAHDTSRAAAQNAGVPCLRWLRPPSDLSNWPNLRFVDSHEEAAQLAVSFGRPIFLTTGSKNLAPYIAAARSSGIPLYARLLPCEEARRACRQAGLAEEFVVFARGPFSTEDTLELIRRYEAGVLVTKESGAAGGVPEKLRACAETGCKCVMVRRADSAAAASCSTMEQLFFWLVDQGVVPNPACSA